MNPEKNNNEVDPQFADLPWPADKCAIAVLDASGHRFEATWDPAIAAEVTVAEAAFAALRKAGHLLFATSGASGGGGQRDKLDPERNHVAVRQFAGG